MEESNFVKKYGISKEGVTLPGGVPDAGKNSGLLPRYHGELCYLSGNVEAGISMQQVTYCVVSREGAWAIRLNEKYFGPCSSKGQATTIAISAAAKALTQGYSARVLIEHGEGFVVAWSNGRLPKRKSEAA